MLTLAEEPFHEWVIAAKLLVNVNPDATLFDLMQVMYEYKTGHKFPEFAAEEDVVDCHMNGMSSKQIAEAYEEEIGNINAILESCGFKPFKRPLGCAVEDIVFSEKEFSKYKVDRAVHEYDSWLFYVLQEGRDGH